MVAIPQTPGVVEAKRRENVSLWAFADLVMNDPIVPENVFNCVARQVDIHRVTGDILLDVWYRQNFAAEDAVWIYVHPEFEKIRAKYYDIRQKQIQKALAP